MSSSTEMLKNLMILQLEAFKALAAEHHQHTEAYVQQFGKLPLTQEPSRAAHDARISLRSSSSASPSLADGCAVSEVILEATKWHCGADMCATSPKHLEMFLEIARNDVKTTEDRVHALFVLNASLSGKEMLTQFESKQGYELLVEWFAAACTYNDATSKGFSDLLLRVLQRNVPNMSFTTKTVLKSLSQYKKLVVGKDNKALLQTVLSSFETHRRDGSSFWAVPKYAAVTLHRLCVVPILLRCRYLQEYLLQTDMEGYLDHLETVSHVGMHKKIWTRRYFKLNSTFGVLEFFSNETQQERKGKLELCGAVVSTADELGELLSDSKSAVEKTRRFIFRITENGNKKHHHLCADLSDPKTPPSQAYAQASLSRGYLDEWLHALRTAIAAQEDSSLSSATMGFGELNAQIGAFMNHMHLSARVSGRVHANGKSIYEIFVKAWILERELVMEDEDQEEYRSYGRGSVGSGEMSWQILEYSCAWKLLKSTAELQNFDGQFRLLFGSKMQNIVFPSSSIRTKLQQFHLHASASQKESENLQRMQVYDAYLQSLLRLPTFSSFGSDASTMLDTFLDISPHLAAFRKLEKESGQSMHLRDRKVVPWKERERFEVIYKLHLQVIAAQEEKGARMTQIQALSHRKESREDHHRRHSHHQRQEVSKTTVYAEKQVAPIADVAPLPAPMKLTAAAEEARPGESVKERIARIGQRLVIEAFEA